MLLSRPTGYHKIDRQYPRAVLGCSHVFVVQLVPTLSITQSRVITDSTPSPYRAYP